MHLICLIGQQLSMMLHMQISSTILWLKTSYVGKMFDRMLYFIILPILLFRLAISDFVFSCPISVDIWCHSFFVPLSKQLSFSMIGLVFTGGWIYRVESFVPFLYLEYRRFFLARGVNQKNFDLKWWQNSTRNPHLQILRKKIHC